MTLQHVALETAERDVPGLLRALGLLGFEPVPVPDGLVGKSVWVQRGATQVHLLLTEDPVAPPRGHVAITVDDYEATLAALRAEGLAPEPRTQYWGAARSFVRVPGGHRVEVMAAPPT